MVEEEDKQSHHEASGQQFDFTFYILHNKDVPRFYNFLHVTSITCVLITEKSFFGWWWWWRVTQQKRVTPSPSL